MTKPANWPAAWADKMWKGEGYPPAWTLFEEELLRLYNMIPARHDGARISNFFPGWPRSARRTDRALQLLKSKGLIVFDRAYNNQPKHWMRT